MKIRGIGYEGVSEDIVDSMSVRGLQDNKVIT